MPRTRSSQTESSATVEELPKSQQPPEISEFLDDGHPNPKAMDVWELMQRLTADQWNQYVAYLYRVFPKKMPTDKDKYIGVYTSAITREDIKKKFGGKKYTMHFNRRIGTRQSSVYPPIQFDIEAEPIWQDGEEPLEPTAAKAAVVAQTAQNDQVLGMFEKVLTDLIKQRDDAMKDGRQFNPTSAIQQALQIHGEAASAAIKLVADQGKGSGDGMVAVILPLMLELIKGMNSRKEDPYVAKLIERAFATPAVPPDPLDQLDKIMNIAERIKGGGGRGGSDWSAVAMEFARNNPGILAGATDLLKTTLTARATAPPVPAAVPTAVPPTGRLATASPPAVPPSVPSAVPPASPPELTEEQLQQIVILRIKQVIVQMLFAGEDGSVAAELADKMHPGFAAELKKIVKTDLSQLASDPVLGQAATHANLGPFCQQYVSYFEEEPESVPADS